eukprot:7253962-Prymnesium_polylepis.1
MHDLSQQQGLLERLRLAQADAPTGRGGRRRRRHRRRSGRGAREVDETALVVHVPSMRSVSQYLQVINSPHNSPLVGVNFLIEQLATG